MSYPVEAAPLVAASRVDFGLLFSGSSPTLATARDDAVRGSGKSGCMAQKLLQYDVLERLGEGARSVIYAVSDPATRQVFALKHVIRAEPKDLRFIEQVETEYEISRQFTHPNLRRSYELKLIKTMLVKISEAYLVMEMVDGKPLDVRP